MFSIWKTGAIFCPINFNYKNKLLSYQLNDLNPRMIITESGKIKAINDIAHEIKKLPIILHVPEPNDHDYIESEVNQTLNHTFETIQFKELLDGESKSLEVDLNYHDTANIIYTSGTIGPAKGVVQSYRWMHCYTYFLRAFNTQEDIIYNDLPLYHTGGAIANVVRGAFLGSTVAIWNKFSPKDFWNRIRVSGASNAILLDVMIPWLMKEAPSETDRNNTLNRVHMQPLPAYHHKFAKRFGINFVSAGYSQTESANSTVAIFDQLSGKEGTPLHLYKGYTHEETEEITKKYNIPFIKGNTEIPRGFMGTPTPYIEVTILNEHDERCYLGEIGQICLRPKFPYILLKEYFNKPEKTVETTTNMWFHTGNKGYYDENGMFYFVDRMNDVIRQKGENISSYQVEDMINQHPDIQTCTVFPIPAVEGEEDDIVVYVVPKSSKLNEKLLKEWIKNVAPKFMWPRYVRFVSDLPRTPTNKVEKFTLKKQIMSELNMY